MSNEQRLETIRNDYNWKQAFEYAEFSIDDIAEVVFSVDGVPDEDYWVGVFKLRDGRFGYLSAGCDYTGWD